MNTITMVRLTPIFNFDAVTLSLLSRICNTGYITDLIVVLPNFTNVITGTLTIEDDEANTLWTDPGAPRAKNAAYVVSGIRVPVDDGFNFKMTLSGAAGGSGGTAKAKVFLGNP